MECYWKTILLLLAVVIQSGSSHSTEPSSTVSQATNNITTFETSPMTSSTTESTPNTTTSSVVTDTTPEQTTVSITSSNSFVPSSASSETTNTNTGSTSATVQSSTSSAESTTASATTTNSTSPTQTTTNTSTTNTTPSTPTTNNTPTTNTPPSAPTTSNTPTTNTTPSTLTTTNTPSPTLTTNNSPSTTAATSGETTPAPPSLGILISETNLLLTNDSSRYFVEIQVSKNIDSVWLVIQNASTDDAEGLLLNYHINISSIDNDLYIYKNFTGFSDKLMDLDSVLIALYAEEVSAGSLTTKGLHDILLYSSSGNISRGLEKLFANIFSQNLIINYEKLDISVPFSLSRCSEHGIANIAAVLTTESPKQNNVCNFTFSKPLEMKLTMKNQPCSQNSPTDFQNALINCVISYVNEEEQLGLTAYMMPVKEVKPVCISDGTELDVKFTVNSAFHDQGTLIMNEYMNFVSQQKLNIKGEYYYLTNCYKDCFDGTTPTSTDDNRIRVTVAVVVSCIGVFLLVLLFVVLYLRRKRKGILQFHMTRLDEDDDLVGDMDDFVGNQGATFRNYR